MNVAKNPALIYMGGKFLISDWIISFFPSHKKYVEPFSGAASVLFKKNRSKMEIINDLNNELVNLFKVLRDSPEGLHQKLLLTPYSRIEYYEAYNIEPCDSIEKARRTIVKSWMGVGSNSTLEESGFRKYAKDITFAPRYFNNFIDNIFIFSDRLRSVLIENIDAFDLIVTHQSYDTLFYIDPPYLDNTRTSNKKYIYEMCESDHEKLLKMVVCSESKYIISGYDNQMYNDILTGFVKKKKITSTFLQHQRVENIWISQNCIDSDLFGVTTFKSNQDV